MGADSPKMSSYQLMREKRIAENKALMESLGLVNLSKELQESVRDQKAKKAAAQPKKKKPVIKKEPAIPTRSSSRLAGLEADSETAKRKAEDEYQLVKEAERAKRLRVSGDLDLKDIVVEGQWDKSQNFLVDVTRGKRFEKTFTEDDIRETTDKDLKQLRQTMNRLKLYEKFEPTRIHYLCHKLALLY
jgi:hypothetical protein